jgi:ferredoxin-type protein NapF
MMDYVLESATTTLETRKYLRPPGALPEKLFVSSCKRCGSCAQACPNKCIQLLPETVGIEFGTPIMNYTAAGCDMCRRCIEACPTKVLSEDYIDQPIGKAIINRNICMAASGGICSQNCLAGCSTYNAIDNNSHTIPEIDPNRCMGCGECIHSCIMSPSAIQVETIQY